MKKTAVKYKVFNSKLTSVISISMVLFLLGIVTVVLYVGNELSSYVKENFTISVTLYDSATDEEINNTKKELEQKSYIKTLQYISKDDAIKELALEMGEDPVEFIGFNPLSPSYEINLTSTYADNDSIIYIAKEIEDFKIVKEVNYQKKFISDVTYNIKKLSLVFLSVAILLLLISFVLINNTVRLLVYSDRFIIHTMKLVGATKWFIQKPYIKQGMQIGLIASLFAIIYMGLMFYFMRHELELFIDLKDIRLYSIICCVLITSGLFITAASTCLAVRKYLAHKIEDLYYM